MIDTGSAKRHLRIEHNADDFLIYDLCGAATEYVTGITGIENSTNTSFKYDLVCLLLVSHWYNNREASTPGTISKIPYGVDMLLQSLRHGGSLI